MKTSSASREEQTHPLVRPHPETGRLAIFGAPLSYVVGFESYARRLHRTTIGAVASGA